MTSVKVDTTPHDLTVCLFDCLSQAASKLDFSDAISFLEQVDLIRWSTTITSNVLAELHGPRVGLLITRGHEQNLYGSDSRSPVLGRFLNDRDVIGINGSSTETEIMNAARSLLETGARRICISLKGSQQESRTRARLQENHRSAVSRSFSRIRSGSRGKRNLAEPR